MYWRSNLLICLIHIPLLKQEIPSSICSCGCHLWETGWAIFYWPTLLFLQRFLEATKALSSSGKILRCYNLENINACQTRFVITCSSSYFPFVCSARKINLALKFMGRLWWMQDTILIQLFPIGLT